MRVALIGARGLVGSALVPRLTGDYDLLLLDRRRDRSNSVRGLDARRVRTLTRALRGCDAVVDLAADAAWSAPWTAVYRNNIRLTVAVLESARLAGVPTVVHASSNQVAAGYERDEPWSSVVAGRLEDLEPCRLPQLSVGAPPRPVNAYGAAKAFSEAACAWYAEEYGLTTTCLRIGSLLNPDRPRNARHMATWLSHRDLHGFVDGALRRPQQAGASVAWAVSLNTWRIWDVSDTERLCGYAPADDAETWRGTATR
jgi:Nucleoside-diphosphate-sugar epimerases